MPVSAGVATPSDVHQYGRSDQTVVVVAEKTTVGYPRTGRREAVMLMATTRPPAVMNQQSLERLQVAVMAPNNAKLRVAREPTQRVCYVGSVNGESICYATRITERCGGGGHGEEVAKTPNTATERSSATAYRRTRTVERSRCPKNEWRARHVWFIASRTHRTPVWRARNVAVRAWCGAV